MLPLNSFFGAGGRWDPGVLKLDPPDVPPWANPRGESDLDWVLCASERKLPTTTCNPDKEVSKYEKQFFENTNPHLLGSQFMRINQLVNFYFMVTCMGDAAVSIPATPPPITRPSLPARETLRPPVRCRAPPPTSVGRYEPDNESISNRPWKSKDLQY